MEHGDDLVYDYRGGRLVPRVPGVVRMDRAVIYIRKQLEKCIQDINDRRTKGLGESVQQLYEFSTEVGQICALSGDGFVGERVDKVVWEFNERTPRQEALTKLGNLLSQLEDYEPVVEFDDRAPKTKGTSQESTSSKSGQPDTSEKSSVFVIMPFRPEFNDVWRGGIQRAAEDEGFKAIRVDMINRSTNITDDIVVSIDKCHLAIIDVTDNNPNVMFELGYTLAKQKPNIIISQSADYLPFDIRNIRTIVYSNSWTGIEELKTKVQTFLQDYKTKEASGSKRKNSSRKKQPSKRKNMRRSKG